MKESEVIQLAKNCGFSVTKAKALKLEASGREYYRINLTPNETKVLCYLNPKNGDHENFLHVSKFFFKEKKKSPKIFYFNNNKGITIQEDLGDKCLIDLDLSSNSKKIIKKSLTLLAKIQKANIPQIPILKSDDLIVQMHKFNEEFLNNFLGVLPHNDIDKLQNEAVKELAKQPWMNCHCDFERRNLIKHDDAIAVIDFQDLSRGPIGIDLAGLIIDHYVKYSDNMISSCLDHYCYLMKFELNSKEIFEWVRWGAIQRNMRILGTLSSLYISKNRSFRLKDLPMILNNLIDLIPKKYVSLKNHFCSDVQSQLLNKLNQI